MVVKLVSVVVLTAAFGVLGEIIVRRNRRTRALRAQLAANGHRVQGTIRTLDKVSAGKFGSYKVRAHIDYSVGDSSYTHIAAWWPQEAANLALGGTIELTVDPADPAVACVAAPAAPDIERDSLWRWLTVGVGVVAVVLALVS